jgi:LysM repeat protein
MRHAALARIHSGREVLARIHSGREVLDRSHGDAVLAHIHNRDRAPALVHIHSRRGARAVVHIHRNVAPALVQQGSAPTTPPGASTAVSGTVLPSGKSASPGNSAVHVIKRGDTLNKISRLYRKPVADIANANNIQLTTRLKVGDHLVIPSVTVNSEPGSFPAKISNHSATSLQSTTAQAKAKHPVKTAKETTALPMFQWPVQGRIIASFGSSLNGVHNDGINLAVPEGTPVKAAEDGVVSYAGNGLAGDGNLILIRHSNGYSTVYAHAKELLVNRDDQIKRGQVIAHSGQTGNVNAPQLHFEVRKGVTPLDPMRFLKG